mmetsp:Transcript_98436/g.301097  ORF Transcript_98436/g.301097 Transcript_98436/m.301097 type:complete len:210 (-) Transcript_98436:949-1578(-)
MHHTMELSIEPNRGKDRPRNVGRLHSCSQTERSYAHLRLLARRGHPRGGVPQGCFQHGARHWPRLRRAPCGAPSGRHDQFHRLHACGPAHFRGGRRDVEGGQDRAGRQKRGGDAGRRPAGQAGPRVHAAAHEQQRAELRRAEPHAGAQEQVRRGGAARQGLRGEVESGRVWRREGLHGAPRIGGPMGEGARPHPEGHRRGRPGRLRRPG